MGLPEHTVIALMRTPQRPNCCPASRPWWAFATNDTGQPTLPMVALIHMPLQAMWLPEIQAMVGIINESFSANFARIGCAGEVRLREAEEFDKYAIEIA